MHLSLGSTLGRPFLKLFSGLLDEFAGASAAYSLRKLRNGYSGDAVRIRREVDDVEVNVAFDSSNEVSDSSGVSVVSGSSSATTLGAFLTEDVNAYTSDFSADVDGFFTTAQGTLAGNIDSITDGQGTTKNDVLRYTQDINPIGANGYARKDGKIDEGNIYSASFDILIPSANLGLDEIGSVSVGGESFSGITVPLDTWTNITVTGTQAATSNSFRITFDASSNTPNPIGDVAYIHNVVLTAIEHQAFVHTWYDQSGNSRNAVQTTDGDQPLIATAGNLLTNGLDFDGTDDFFSIDFGSNLSQPNSIFMVHQSDSILETNNEFFDEKDTTGQRTLLDVTTVGAERRYRMLAQGNLNTTNAQVTTDKNLVVAIYNGSNSSISLNGNAFNFTDSVGDNSIARLSAIGFSEGTNNYYDGTMDEFIIYNSDESSNRTSIENNINAHYSIYS